MGGDLAGDVLTGAAEAIRAGLPGAEASNVLVIAGSGLGGFVKSVEPVAEVSYKDIPGVGGSTVKGHAGKLVLGRLSGSSTPVLLMAGRRHLYEGLTASEAAMLPQSILAAIPSIQYVIISNAAGGVNPEFAVGDMMLITDHINWMFQNPLVGPNREHLGPRFPDASDIYSNELRQVVREIALEQGVKLREGIYIAMHGPSYETRSEVAMARHLLGADAVGMSTAPEALVASHAGKQVVGISFISNLLTVPAVTSHEEVVSNAALVEVRFRNLVSSLIEELHKRG